MTDVLTDAVTAEHDRIAGADADRWRAWGPFLAERSWGTVREDYSPDGEAWGWFPFDHARSRAYRWVEDGLAGLCDRRQGLCLGLALWNGADPILKERLFGLGGKEGNHGEDVKECYWFLDAVPSHSWLRWRYHYPQAAFPYDDLIAENARRGFDEPEYELLDTGVFDDGRFFSVEVAYAKRDPDDICMRITARNHGDRPGAAAPAAPALVPQRVVVGQPRRGPRRPPAPAGERGRRRRSSSTIRASAAGTPPRPTRPARRSAAGSAARTRRTSSASTAPTRRLRRPDVSAYPKDGIGDHVVAGAPTVDPDGVGTKAACWFTFEVAAGAEVEVRLRLRRVGFGRPRRPASSG